MGQDAIVFFFWMLSFKIVFSFSSFIFTKRLFSSSSLSATRVVSSAYLRLLIFLLAILFPACASSSLIFCLKYSVYKLNKQGDNMYIVTLTYSLYILLSQFWTSPLFHVQLLLDLHTDFIGGRSGGLVFPSLEEFSTACYDPHKGFSLVNEVVDVFLALSCFLYDPTYVSNLISDSSAFSKSSL